MENLILQIYNNNFIIDENIKTLITEKAEAFIKKQNSKITINEVEDIINKEFDIEYLKDLYNIPINKMRTSRKKEIVAARQTFHYILKTRTPWSLNKIGFLKYKKNHATVINSIKIIKNYIDTDKEFRKKIINIENQLNQYSEIIID